jgi:hypothetical protein
LGGTLRHRAGPGPPAPSGLAAADLTWTADGNAARYAVPDWSNAFADLPPGRARSTRATRWRVGLAVVVAALMLMVAGGVALWPSPKREDHLSTGTPPDQDPLAALLPRGYPPGACAPSPDVMLYPASLTSGQNADPGGPAVATYQLVGARTPRSPKRSTTPLRSSRVRTARKTSSHPAPGAGRARKPLPECCSADFTATKR